MKSEFFYLLLIALVFASCAKTEQLNETIFTATVLDPTSGQLTQKGLVNLVEIETPSRPITAQTKKIIEWFEVDFNEPFSYEFNAKIGIRFEYFLEYQYPDDSFGSHASSNGFFYQTFDEVRLEKAKSMEYELFVVPLTSIKLRSDNSGINASENDSVRMELFDGSLLVSEVHKGTGKFAYESLKIPHGEYTFSYWAYRSGQVVKQESYSINLTHNQETILDVVY